jgi:archaellum component FlaC
MTDRDARDIMFDTKLQNIADNYEEQLSSERRKWEFRYNNQDKRIKELQDTIARLRKKIKDLKNG